MLDGDLNDIKALIPVMQSLSKSSSAPPLVVVAHKFSEPVLQFMAINAQGGVYSLAALETPMNAQPNSKTHFLNDLAAFSAGKVFDATLNPIPRDFKEFNIEDLGTVEKIRIGKYRSVFIGTIEEAEDLIAERIEALKTKMTHAESEYD